MRTVLKVVLALATLGAVLWLIRLDIPALSLMLQVGLLAVFVLLLFLVLFRFGRRLLWRVGRRLAFSYFLIGVLPIPMLLLGILLRSAEPGPPRPIQRLRRSPTTT